MKERRAPASSGVLARAFGGAQAMGVPQAAQAITATVFDQVRDRMERFFAAQRAAITGDVGALDRMADSADMHTWHSLNAVASTQHTPWKGLGVVS